MAKNKKNDKGKNNELDSSVKVFEESTLIERADQRKKDYENLKDKLQTLKTACDGVADLGDDFTGKGADNIKEFFRGQSEVVDSWIVLADMQIAFFKGVAGDVKDKKLTDSYIEMSFLKTELKNADKSSDQIVLDLKKNMDAIINRVNDIVDLDKWTDHDYTVEMSKAQTTRKNAIDAVDDLDESLTGEYIRATAEAGSISKKFSALMEATSNGKSASPMYFDKKAFHSNKSYKEAIKTDKQATEYIKAKKEQAKARELQAKQEEEIKRLKKLQEEEENKPWYEKALEGTKTFVGEMSGYYDYKRAKDGVDPVTGEKLTPAERVAAGAMATAGFIPVIGWAGRAAKGGRAIYKTAKTFSAAEHALQAYKTTKGMQVLKMTEMGAYGLAASNGFSEALTGKDMFGQKVSKEKQGQGFIDATLNMVGAKAAAGTRAVSGTTRAAARARNVAKPSQRMTHLIKAATKKYPLAKSPIDVIMKQTKKMLKHVGRIKVPVKPRLHVHQPVAATGHHIGIPSIHMHVEKKTLGEIGHGIVKFARGSGSTKSHKAVPMVEKDVNKGTKSVDIPPAFKQEEFASSYQSRLNQTPSPTNPKIEFEGIRGESLSTLKPPPDPKLKRILDEAGVKGIQYKNGVPDFSPVSKAQIEIDYMLGGKGSYGGKARTYNFAQADQKLADKLNDSVELARQFGMESGAITAKDIDKYRTKNKLTWHEVNDVKIIQLVPTEINKRFGHLGGVGEINAGAFEPGGFANKKER
ncbi:T7SS effector LXG polymorphic toxin [Bacillus sp. CLL-7-23]|uniref:T7SS effector LXG polymorphic toxin n=1 Tax=Bacillus changyiensis TaxID=3004103 RepID=A0ABT4X5G0_9BACI|nr:T7SS effector LXG polymorphic toxin [Bacillus changyiensis]MDA7027415.1 T7SS effector LXG polymorphic toxin [Bacillus changyiensis]